MDAIAALLAHWRGFDPDKYPFVHPADRAAIQGVVGLTLDALPYPFVGDVAGADTWLLMLNSNVGDTDIANEAEPYMAQLLRNNLSQDLAETAYPFFSLDPRLKDTGTFRYYDRRCCFGSLIAEHARLAGMSLQDSRKLIARRVAVIQYYPYRSKGTYPSGDFADATPSTKLAIAAVKAAQAASKLIVVPRSAPKWGYDYGINDPGHLITHRADQARSPSVKPTSTGGSMAGGDAILHRLLGQA